MFILLEVKACRVLCFRLKGKGAAFFLVNRYGLVRNLPAFDYRRDNEEREESEIENSAKAPRKGRAFARCLRPISCCRA